MEKLKVCCLKAGDKYDSDYVNILFSMVSRHLSLPFEFICFTEDSRNLNNEVIVKNIKNDTIKGWWNKCLLFKPQILSGTCLYLDLDMIIVNNIDDFIIKNNFLNLLSNSIIVNGIHINKINSSMMVWDSNNYKLNNIWSQYSNNKLFYDNHTPKYGEELGDQKVIIDSKVEYKFFSSKKIRYFKFVMSQKDLEKNIAVIVCKGKKQKDFQSNHLVKKYWRL